jgi:predicted secreted protein with PEFG-CTERM motif
MRYGIFLILPFLIFTTPIFAQTPTSNELSNSLQYVVKFDEHVYSISYVVNADIVAMKIDPESKSLLIGLNNAHDSQFFIGLEHELIKAQNNEFIILVDGQEADYQIVSDTTSSTFEFFVPAGTEEVEIIGTSVIPEFPLGAIFGFAVMISSIMIVAKVKASFFKL